MNAEEKARLERQFDRKLTDGEAEEIDRQPIVQQEKEGLFENMDDSVIGLAGVPATRNGQ